MEKTDEIDENTQFFKDLEMLRSSQPGHISSYVDEICLLHSEDGLATFLLQGKKVEQFGLFTGNEDKQEKEANVGGITIGNGYAEEEK